MPKIFIANVGVNASHPLRSPIFPDGTFEFIPIPDVATLTGRQIQTYSDLRSFYRRKESLLRHIPGTYWSHPVHNDPEFDTFTYGDNCGRAARAAALKSVRTGDILLFYARLTEWSGGQFDKLSGFYFIGLLEVSLIVPDIRRKPAQALFSKIGSNAHMRRALSDSKYFNGFWVFKGSDKSERFTGAAPLTHELASQVFRTTSGERWVWRKGASDLQTIGSYLRSCRCCLDTALRAERERARILFDAIRARNPEMKITGFL